MHLKKKESSKGLRIQKIYYFAISIYMLPLVSLGIFIVNPFSINGGKMHFWVLFLIGMIPCGLIGLTLSIIGLIKSFKNGIILNKIIGFIGFLIGLISLIGGRLGIMIIYVVIGD